MWYTWSVGRVWVCAWWFGLCRWDTNVGVYIHGVVYYLVDDFMRYGYKDCYLVVAGLLRIARARRCTHRLPTCSALRSYWGARIKYANDDTRLRIIPSPFHQPTGQKPQPNMSLEDRAHHFNNPIVSPVTTEWRARQFRPVAKSSQVSPFHDHCIGST